MKKVLILLGLSLASVIQASSVVTAGGKLEFVDGKVEFSVPGSSTKTIFTPVARGTAQGPFSAVVINEKNARALALRGNGCSLTFRLDNDGRSACRVALPYQVDFSVQTATETIVVPDAFGEDLLLKSTSQALALPGQLPFFMALQEGENQTLSVIPFRGKSNITISGDLKTWTFSPGLLEEYTFVINQADKIWHKTSFQQEGKDPKAINYLPPIDARYRAAYPVKNGYTGDLKVGHYVWNVCKKHPKYQVLLHRPPRMSVSNQKNWIMWCSGFDGTFRYPALQQADSIYLSYPNHAAKGFAYAKGQSIYLYAYDTGNPDVKAGLPMEYLDAEGIAKMTNERNTSIGVGPATCHLTSNVIEKIFYRGEAISQKAQLLAALERTQLFVESVRARINNYMEWSKSMDQLCRDTAQKDADAGELEGFADKLKAFQKYHDELLPRMQTPEAAYSYQQTLLAAVNDSSNDEEVLEEKGKIYGRETRTIGGAQDTCLARMRHITKCIRQNALAAFMQSSSESARQVYWQIYTSAAEMMQNYYDHEGK